MSLHILLGPFPWVNGAPAPGGKDYLIRGGVWGLDALPNRLGQAFKGGWCV